MSIVTDNPDLSRTIASTATIKLASIPASNLFYTPIEERFERITRLARKEVNAQTKAIRKANAQYRRDIAQLKRQAGALSKQVAYLERQERKRASKGVFKAATEGKRFSARGLKAHRQKVDLSAADYAKLL